MLKHYIFNNTPICYQTNGNISNTCLLFLHGFGETAHVWDEAAAVFGQNYYVIVPDIAGTGLSPMPVGEAWSLEYNAAALAAILQYENISSAIVIGHSMGGYIALAFAARYSALLKGLVLYHSCAQADSDVKKQSRNATIESIKGYGTRPFIKNFAGSFFTESFMSANAPAVDNFIRQAESLSSEFLRAATLAMRDRPDNRHLLAQIDCPIGFVAGKQDKFIPYTQTLAECILPKRTYIKIIAEAGHASMFEAPAAGLSALNRFFSYAMQLN